MTTEILPAFDASAPPVYVHQGDRSVTTYWAVNPFDAPDAEGDTPHVKLSVGHEQGAYVATLITAMAHFTDGNHHELLIGATRPVRVHVARLPAPRFNRAKFDAFVTLAVDTVVTTYGAND